MSVKLVRPECILSVPLEASVNEFRKKKADRLIPFALAVALILPIEYLPSKDAFFI